MIKYQLSKNKRYLELFPGGILHINPRSSSHKAYGKGQELNTMLKKIFLIDSNS
jgi:hypothetical protein